MRNDKEARSLPTPRPPYDFSPATKMTTKQWKLFWRVPMAHGVRTVWWRLLTQKLSTQEALRHIRTATENPGMCKICKKFIEDDYHMIYDCSLKSSFWKAANHLLGMELTGPEICQALTFEKQADDQVLIHLGDTLRALWLHHWRGIIEKYPWNNTHAMRQLRNQLWQKGENHHSDAMISQYETAKANEVYSDAVIE
ncbi:hypothetical protein BCR42DRAFT_338989 [Absidia repens]|uniref:Reverse transcriptase zinc-binding domain-containing protein n=1 Tax=Absidia repens TaxID=90262 RepID=A0A1X2HRA9_9FUNG|nr:hypothetical protein BCR42DRAFT_338989 [Absidia repens]